MDKVSSKADRAISRSEAFSFSAASAKELPISPSTAVNEITEVRNNIQRISSELNTRIHDVETDIMRIDHEAATTRDRVNELKVTAPSHVPPDSVPTPRYPGIPPAKQPLAKQPPLQQLNNADGRAGNGALDTNSNSNDNAKKGVTKPFKLSKTLIIMDSNGKHLVHDQLWKNSTHVFNAKAQELLPRVTNLLQTHKPDLVLIHNGVNDLDKQDGATVARSILAVVKRMKTEHPDLNIVVSEVTPRQLNKDDQVLICNEHLHTYFDKMDKVTMAVHSNLRTEDWSYYDEGDNKHLANSTIKHFASNLKAALREAVGIHSHKDTAQKKGNMKKNSRKSGLDKLKNMLLEVLQGK